MKGQKKEGSREELADYLDDMSEGWSHLAKDSNSEEAASGADQLRSGAQEVTVGHTTYRVVDE